MREDSQQSHVNPRMGPRRPAYRRQLLLIGLIAMVTIGAGWLGAVALQHKLMAASGELIALMAADVASQLDLLFVDHYRDVQFLADVDLLELRSTTLGDLLQTFKRTHLSYLWIGATDSTGHVMASTNPATIGYDAHATDWYRAAKESGMVYFADAQPDELADGMDAVSFTAPIRRRSVGPGEPSFAGVVSTKIEAQTIERIVTDTLRSFQRRGSFFRTVEYQVFREDGIVFIDSDLHHKGGVNLRKVGLLSALLSQSGYPAYIEEEHLHRGVPVVTGYAKTRGNGQFPNPGWTVLFRVDRAEVLAPLYRFFWMASGTGLLLAVPVMAWLVRATGQAQAGWIEAEDERARSRENERRLRSILEAEPEGVLVIGHDRRVLQINPAGCVLFDADFSEEIVGRDVTDFVYADDRRLIEEAYDTAREGRESCGRGRLVGLSGQIRWIEMTSVPLPSDDGTVQSVLSVVRDVTEQKRADRRQALQHAVAKVLAEASTVEQAVPELWRAIGLSLEWHVGLFWRLQERQRVLTCVQDWSSETTTVQDFFRVSRQAVFTSGIDLPGRCWVRGEPLWMADVLKTPEFSRGPAAARDGLHAGCAFPIWLRANVFGVMEFYSREAHVQDTDLLKTLGTIGSQIGLFIERAEVEAALRESETRTRLIIDTALDAVVTMDKAGCIIEWNVQAEQIFGWSAHEAIGRDLAETVIPPVQRTVFREHIERFFSPEHEIVRNTLLEMTGLRRDGREFPVEMAIVPLHVEESVSFSAFIRDITGRKEAERSLRDYALQLEKINRQLDAALTEAKAATEAKSFFLATMSHEIRTPMNGVIGMTGLLLDTKLTAEQREYADTVRHCGDHLLTIINDILDFSKIEAGKLDLEVIEFDLRVAIEESLDLLAERASSKRLNLACLFHADVPRGLLGDPGRLRQIVMNLAGNAIKFTERGEVAIRVTVDTQSDLEATIRIAITDTGIGISAEAHERLFQSFSQADGSTTRKYGGTGLGLAICKRLVEMMGGEIGVASQPAEGSCFWFTVCLRKQTGSSLNAEPFAAALVGLRVLIVDDKLTNRTIMELLTRKWGMRPTLIESGPAVLELVGHRDERPPFDVALLDVDMEIMDGLELARRMKGRADCAGIPLVLLTSVGRRGDAKAAREAGLAAYLTKPVRERQLHDCLVAIMTQQAGVSASGATAPLITRHSLADAKAKAGCRILLAEDNIINQKVAVRLFERLGYRLDVVANGREAVEALSRISYDLVFMDCQMPEMDGFQATAEIRSREAGTRHTVIIAMTANAMQGDRERCLAAGMDDYVSKPVTVEALADVIHRRVFSHGRARQGPRPEQGKDAA